MIDADRCPARHRLTGLRCDLYDDHYGLHRASGGNGSIFWWDTRVTTEAAAVSACTFDELLGHLADLAELAEAEGFAKLAEDLHRAHREIAARRSIYDQRSSPPGPPAADATR